MKITDEVVKNIREAEDEEIAKMIFLTALVDIVESVMNGTFKNG